MNSSNNNLQNMENSQASPYNWLGVLEFLQDQFKEQTFKESEWLLEKQQLQDKITQLEGEVKAHDQINMDLLKRVKMLEFSLRQERIRYNKLLQEKGGDTNIIQNALDEKDQNLPQIPKRRAKGHRPLLSKILEEVGLEDIFKSTEYKAQEQLYQYQSELLEPENVQQIKHNKYNNLIEKSIEQLEKTSEQITQQQNEIQNSNNIDKIVQQIDQNDQVENSTQVLQTSNQQNQGHLIQKYQIRANLDGVRDVCFVNEQIIVTVSEDCMVKLWDANQIQDQIQQQNGDSNIDPYFTMREHTGPLFTITSSQQNSQNENIFFTAGSEGLIKCWNVPLANEIDILGETDKLNYCIGTWNCHEDVIWQIVHHPYDNELISSSAEGNIKLWSYNQQEMPQQCMGIFRQQFERNVHGQNCIPTSVDYIYSNLQLLVSGFVDQNCLSLFHKETGKILQEIQFDSNQRYSQVNKVISHENMMTLFSGHDDNLIRVFDINSNKIVQQIQGHNDSVIGLTLNKNGQYLYSVSHDGSLKTWDIRNLQNSQCIETLENIHLKKYDETIFNISKSYQTPYLATAGADGNVNLFNIQ